MPPPHQQPNQQLQRQRTSSLPASSSVAGSAALAATDGGVGTDYYSPDGNRQNQLHNGPSQSIVPPIPATAPATHSVAPISSGGPVLDAYGSFDSPTRHISSSDPTQPQAAATATARNQQPQQSQSPPLTSRLSAYLQRAAPASISTAASVLQSIATGGGRNNSNTSAPLASIRSQSHTNAGANSSESNPTSPLNIGSPTPTTASAPVSFAQYQNPLSQQQYRFSPILADLAVPAVPPPMMTSPTASTANSIASAPSIGRPARHQSQSHANAQAALQNVASILSDLERQPSRRRGSSSSMRSSSGSIVPVAASANVVEDEGTSSVREGAVTARPVHPLMTVAHAGAFPGIGTGSPTPAISMSAGYRDRGQSNSSGSVAMARSRSVPNRRESVSVHAGGDSALSKFRARKAAEKARMVGEHV
ncbi:hypothetical protein HDU82_005191 [Entophlyctis luteolus]|nr:hypothetical protein HDU82_005191 [Entophlyctis luteolus]